MRVHRFPLRGEPVDAIRGVEGEPAMQLIGQNGAQDRANCVGDQRSVTAQRQKSGKVQDVAGSADEGKTNELSKAPSPARARSLVAAKPALRVPTIEIGLLPTQMSDVLISASLIRTIGTTRSA